jgi:hypothetical protein
LQPQRPHLAIGTASTPVKESPDTLTKSPAHDGSLTANAERTVAPRKGILLLLAFLCLIGVLLHGIDYIITQGLRRITTSAYGVSNRVMSGSANADIVVSGSSRALAHYDTRIIQRTTGHSAFNIGRNGAQTDMQLAYLKAYLRHNKKPKLIIHNLDLFSLQVSHDIYDPAQYLPYLNEPELYTAIHRVYPDAWKWKYLPLYGYVVTDMRFTWLQGIKGFFGIYPREDHFDGYQPRYMQWTGDFERYRMAHAQGVDFEIQPAGIESLTELANICKTLAVPLVFVYSPVYSEMQALERNRNDIFREFRTISDRFGAQFWDLSTSEISKDQNNFYNSQHLNAAGASAFSVELANRLKDSKLLY